MAKKQNTQKEAPALSVEQMKKAIAEKEAEEMRKHTDDFKAWLKERNLTVSIHSVINDTTAAHHIKLVRIK